MLYACTNSNSNLVTITGEITNPKGESVAFSDRDTSYSTTANEEGLFEIEFSLDTSTYLNFAHGDEVTAMFVYPGDKIKLTIDTEQFDESIQYEGSAASSFLAKKFLINEEADFFGEVFYMSSAEEYKAFLDEYKSSINEELEAINDSSFIEDQLAEIDEMFEYYIMRQEKLSGYEQDVRMFMMERTKVSREYDFYGAINTKDSDEFHGMLEEYSKTLIALLENVSDAEFLKTTKEGILSSTDYWSKMKTAVDNVPKEGEPAIDFSYPDKDGNEISLSSLKGKLVYVDVWATWCGPCKAQIPALKVLEEEYHEKNVTFLSVSVDEDKDAWIKMVEEKELGGIQIWASGWTEITKDYAIMGIPRFMLFSAEGNVITTDAPRPSSGDIRGLLDANL